ncbi:MAG TPA: cytochrome c [Pseudomonadales bacterium]|nr:cytochrome c [Pseudomonadales bacterium]
MKRFVYGVIVVGVAVVAIALTVALWPTKTRSIAIVPSADAVMVEQGRYLAAAADCGACHTAADGQPFAGGVPIATPIGTVYGSNITPDRATGIGAYTLDDFDRAVRHGITPAGVTLYPAMPYPSYTRVSDADVAALYAYFMFEVKPVAAANRAPDIRWPLSIRWPLAVWRKTFVPAIAFDTARYSDPVVARGAYLVQGLGHCGSCHTPRALTLQERALDESGSAYLAGGPIIDGWVAVNLRGNSADGLGGWSADDIEGSLRSARNASHAVVGEAMNDVVVHSTQHLSDADLQAVAAYLKTLPPSANESSSFAADPATAQALAAGQEADRGAELYLDNCAVCHHSNGAGQTGVFPAIAGNSSVLAADPESLIRLTLHGGQLPSTAAAPSNLGMPGFGWRLSDAEVAELLTFIRRNWGNQAPIVDVARVSAVRRAMNAKGDASGADAQ